MVSLGEGVEGLQPHGSLCRAAQGHLKRRGQQQSAGTVGRAGIGEGGADMKRNAWQPIFMAVALFRTHNFV